MHGSVGIDVADVVGCDVADWYSGPINIALVASLPRAWTAASRASASVERDAWLGPCIESGSRSHRAAHEIVSAALLGSQGLGLSLLIGASLLIALCAGAGWQAEGGGRREQRMG